MAKTSRRADRVWKRFASWYGARFLEQYGATPPEDWCDTIDRADDERLQTALVVVRREHVNHPPTLGQFEAAIPQRQKVSSASVVHQLAEHALRTLSLCEHQLCRPWSYSGPIEEFHHRGRTESHPRVSRVVIAECEPCSKPSHRVKAEDLGGARG